jgi:hypothetical protein
MAAQHSPPDQPENQPKRPVARLPRGYREWMTDQPIPDRSDELTGPTKLGDDAEPTATGTGDPTGAEAAHPSDGSRDGGRPDGDPPAVTDGGGGDAPMPSPDI